MPEDAPRPAQAAIRTDLGAIFVSMELSRRVWLITSLSPGAGEKMSKHAATVCELDLVQHAIRSSKRAQTLDPNQRPEKFHEPLNLTLDVEHPHVSGPCLGGPAATSSTFCGRSAKLVRHASEG